MRRIFLTAERQKQFQKDFAPTVYMPDTDIFSAEKIRAEDKSYTGS
jgi:hypothetical protein